jgi:hypothetical protein
VRQHKGLFLAPVSVVRQRQGRPACIGSGGHREASSHRHGIDEKWFINKMFCLHGSKLFIGIFMNKIFCLPNIWKTRATILLSILIKKEGKIKKRKKRGNMAIWLGKYENMHCSREIGFILNILDARSNTQPLSKVRMHAEHMYVI